MLSFIIRRIGYALIMVVLVSFVSFWIISLPKGNFLDQKLAQLQARGDKSAQVQIEQLRIRYGFDKPWPWRYWNWAIHFVGFDFGDTYKARCVEGGTGQLTPAATAIPSAASDATPTPATPGQTTSPKTMTLGTRFLCSIHWVGFDFGLAFQYDRPVLDMIKYRLWMTLVLSIATIVVVWILAIPLGVYSAVKQYSIGDQLVTTISFIGLGMPGFLLALLILYFAIRVLNMDVTGLYSTQFADAPMSLAKLGNLFQHLWIPALISAVTGTGGLIRIMRGNLLDTLGQPFVEAARARGLKNSAVIWKHAVRIAILPLIIIFGSEAFPGIIVGNALVSIVLNLPTIGPMFVDALRTLDMYMAGTCIVFFTLLLLIGNLLSDLALAWVDPRIRLD